MILEQLYNLEKQSQNTWDIYIAELYSKKWPCNEVRLFGNAEKNCLEYLYHWLFSKFMTLADINYICVGTWHKGLLSTLFFFTRVLKVTIELHTIWYQTVEQLSLPTLLLTLNL